MTTMIIAQLNKFLFPRGGAERYMFWLDEQLSQRGHTLAYLTQLDRANTPVSGRVYGIPTVDLRQLSRHSITAVGSMFWSLVAARATRQLIARERPHIAHVHNIYHQLSPSVLWTLKRAGVPMVMTVHDLKLITPAYTLPATSEYHLPLSFVRRLILASEWHLHRLLGSYTRTVDLFIAPSVFVKNKLVASGIDEAKVTVLPFGIETPDQITPIPAHAHLLFVGRLDESKGVSVLIHALHELGEDAPPTIIAGDGPARLELEVLAQSGPATDRICFVGRQSPEQISRLIDQSFATVHPSLVHETFGLSVLESLARGRAVIATRVGAYPELVSDAVGLLVPPGDTAALARAIASLRANPARQTELGQTGYHLAATAYTADAHIDKLIDIYHQYAKKG